VVYFMILVYFMSIKSWYIFFSFYFLFCMCFFLNTLKNGSNVLLFFSDMLWIEKRFWLLKNVFQRTSIMASDIYIYKWVFLALRAPDRGSAGFRVRCARPLTCGRRTGQYFLTLLCAARGRPVRRMALRAGFPALLVGGNTVLVSRVNATSWVFS